MKPYFQYKGRLMNANKTSTFKEAVECIEKYIGENNIEVPEVKEENNDANHTEKSITPSKEKKIKATPKRRPNSDASSGGSSAKRIKTDPMRLKDTLLDTSPSSHNAKARVSALLNRPVHIERPETPPLDVGSVSQTLKDKKIEPSGLKFGFLGLGIIGSGIVKNLLNSGHSVMVWNRSSEKS
ncbi:putative oxidoreductase GLYR1 [Portunus trituberculatus]|uniref:Putative oxidoreductase GLYR1 n=1 Tax=Portunus trituberculatus TaxID=210409 RepID=A0A5B7GQI1_PORTR|nr:putative oxidoreductase GLYR1 [Portunus trituberculatus]